MGTLMSCDVSWSNDTFCESMPGFERGETGSFQEEVKTLNECSLNRLCF